MSRKLFGFLLCRSFSPSHYSFVDRSPCLLYAVLLKYRFKNALFFYTAKRLCKKSVNNSTCLNSRKCHGGAGGQDGDHDDSKRRNKMKLMDFPETVWPSPMKFIRNRFLTFLIRSYYDETFTIDGFLAGAEQAVAMVSGYISQGNFTALHDLIDHQAVSEIQMNYENLDMKQRLFTSVDLRDIITKFIYEIGMIFDDSSDKRFVEITVVLQGIHGSHSMKENPTPTDLDTVSKEFQNNYYVCNYRFIREFTKGVESDWTINKLNHFSPLELDIRL